MATNEYKITPANWNGPNGTGWIQGQAGSGHWTERRMRGTAVRSGQLPAQPPQRVQSPLAGLNDAQAFVDEIARDNQMNKARQMIIGGVLGYALVKTAQMRRARR
jgi:hypothetical protein